MPYKSLYITMLAAMLLAIPMAGICQDRTAEAKVAFEEGVAYFNAGFYEEAASAFRRADKIKPTWSLLFNIGQSEAAAKRYDLAYEAFAEYLVKGGDEIAESRRDLVMTELDRLQNLIGSLEITAPNGAVVIVDGMERGTAPLPGRLKLTMGMVHRVEVRQGEVTLLSEEVKVSQGENISLDANAEQSASVAEVDKPAAAVGKDISSPATAKKERDPMISSARLIGAIGIGVGGAALAAGAITGGLALAATDDLEAVCTENSCPVDQKDKKETKDALAMSCDILTISGAAAAGLGIGFLIWSIRERKKGETHEAISIVPAIGGSSAAIGISGRF